MDRVKYIAELLQIGTRKMQHFESEVLPLVIKKDQGKAISKLYHAVKDGLVINDKEGVVYMGITKEAFKKTAIRLTAKLEKAILVVNVDKPQYSIYAKSRHKIKIQQMFLDIMSSLGARQNRLARLQQFLKMAIKYQQTIVIIETLNELRSMSVMSGDKKNYKYTTHLLREYLGLFEAESQMEDILAEVQIEFSGRTSIPKEVSLKIEESVKKAESIVAKHKSIDLVSNYSDVMLFYYVSIEDYRECISICQDAINYLKGFDFMQNTNRIAVWHVYMLDAAIMAGEYEVATEAYEGCIETFPAKNVNYFRARESYCHLLLHQGKYHLATNVLMEAFTSSAFNKMYEIDKETWKLYEAFLNYVYTSGMADPSLANPTFLARKWRIKKYVNDMPLYTKDKAGANFNTIVLQILFLLELKDYAEISKKYDTIRVYSYRYLQGNGNRRGRIFCGMLMKLIWSDYNIEKLKVYESKFLKKMDSILSGQNGHYDSSEIIPYHKIWEHIRGKLLTK